METELDKINEYVETKLKKKVSVSTCKQRYSGTYRNLKSGVGGK